ncbi:MAG: class I SAM-dependent methyltransferase [Limisphaerales bacterium]
MICLLLRQGFDPSAIAVRLAIRNALTGCDRVLDVGCGTSMNMRWFGVKHSTGVEGYGPACEEAKRRKTHDELVQSDIRELDRHFKPRQFDACVALDVIEHLTKEDGLKLMASMERIANKKIIFFTPSGFLIQHHYEQGDLQEHLSGWEPSEMEQHGYQVSGLLGPKSLRGEFHVIQKRPKVFWGFVSFLGHIFWTKRNPAKAAAILCVKTKITNPRNGFRRISHKKGIRMLAL